MICPACHSDMIIVEHDNIELDYCTNCRGAWFDARELELLLESGGMDNTGPFFNSLLTDGEASSSEKKRKCPICRQKMKKVFTDEEKKIMVDVCKDGDGIWFDGGELARLVKSLAEKSPEMASSQSRVTSFLGQVFQVAK